jgi:shikimate kinase
VGGDTAEERLTAEAKKSIALVGMPGGGKSTVGRQLARRLGRGFVDSDVVLEKRIGEPIRSYFEARGEDAFRDVEESVIDEITCLRGAVLATGGGVVLRAGNRGLLHERCHVVYLRSSPEDLFRRLRHDTVRPLLQVADPMARLRELFEVRDPLYRETAHSVIDTGRPSVTTLINIVLMQLELSGIVEADAVPPAANSRRRD